MREGVPTGPCAPVFRSASASDARPPPGRPLTGADAAVFVLLGALALDLAFGDPPNRWHPVAWIGSALARGRRRWQRGGRARLLIAGGALTLGVAAGSAMVAGAVTYVARALGIAGLAVEAIALSTLLSVRGLVAAARIVERHLAAGDLAAARDAVGTHLVSRETRELDEAYVASATVESVAENLTDSVVAPACFYLAFGLPGAAFYRAINTADAMIGYRDDALEHFGKIAARLDDLLNVIPARLGAASIVTAAFMPGFDARRAWGVLRRDRRRTASPNAGWTMSAMAGALDIALEKRDAYRLGDGSLPTRGHIPRAIDLFARATALGVAVLLSVRILVGR